MVVSFDDAKKNSNGALANSGSAAAFVNYMGKEDALKQEQGEQPEKWFSHERDECKPSEVRAAIDSDHQGIGKAEGKFNTGSINPTEEEWKALGKTDAERKENFKAWIQEDFSKEFAGNFHKKDREGNPIPIEADNVKIYYKLEDNRYYKGDDEKVKSGEHKQNEIKEGFNVHCHFIVARKTEDGQNRIGTNTNNKKEFSRDELKIKTEQSFDKRTGYERPLDESYEYAKTMRNGTLAEREAMTEKTILQEQNKPIEQTQKNEQTLIQPQTQEQNHSKGIQM